MMPLSGEAYRLLHDSIKVFSKMELTGIRVDVDYCQTTIKHLKRRIKRMQQQVFDSPLGILGRKTFGFKYDATSEKQLLHLLYTVMDLKSSVKTGSGGNSIKAEALIELNVPGLELIVRWKQLEKAKTTYLVNFLEAEVNGYMHPNFHLHLVRTYRSSSSDPNFQNIPIRDPEIRAICRKAIRPRPGRKLAALDFSGVEVRVGTAYHEDPVMMKYNSDPATDLHRDMAQEIYCLNDKNWKRINGIAPKVAKAIRHSSKNQFVFPAFYGDWYKSYAPNLYKSAHDPTHTLPNNIRLNEWLHKFDIKDYTDFEEHMKEIERAFWKDRFTVYSAWKDKWWSDYQRQGYFDTLTGFRCQGVMGRNNAINYPVQGTAFHCTLWCIIEIDKIIVKNNLESLIIGQIHDEIVLDLVPREEAFLLKECKKIMTEKIRRHWKWINVPMDIDLALTPVDGSWIEEKEVCI